MSTVTLLNEKAMVIKYLCSISGLKLFHLESQAVLFLVGRLFSPLKQTNVQKNKGMRKKRALLKKNNSGSKHVPHGTNTTDLMRKVLLRKMLAVQQFFFWKTKKI